MKFLRTILLNPRVLRPALAVFIGTAGIWLCAHFVLAHATAPPDRAGFLASAMDLESKMRRFAAEMSHSSAQTGIVKRSEIVERQSRELSATVQAWRVREQNVWDKSDGLLGAVHDLYVSAAALIPLLKQQAERETALRRSASEFSELGASIDSAPLDAAAALPALQFSQTFDKVSRPVEMQIGGGQEAPAAALRASVETFRAAASARKKRSVLPREKALLTEMEEIAGALPAQIEALNASRADASSSLERFAATEAQVQKSASASVPTRGRALPGWVGYLLGATGLSSLGICILSLAARECERRRAHVLDILHRAVHESRDVRADPSRCGALRDVAISLNEAIEAWQNAEARSETAHEGLDSLIRARTSDLWRANKVLREESESRGKADREFHQTQKMDALGKLAGSIAHDFNNLLTIILGSVECAKSRIGFNHQASAMLRTAEQAAERAAALTRPLLAFSRSQVISLEALDMNLAAEEVCSALKRSVGSGVEMNIHLHANLPKIRANASQLRQVLINLGENARDAMGGSGTLTIATRETPSLSEGENWIEVAVSDTGCGMDAVTKARIFEPFFTTKPVGKGPGLGLSTVFGIVKQCGGRLTVESEPGFGSTFRVALPPASKEEVAAASSALPAEPIDAESTAYGMLLLVDDEEHIRELASITLESRGYTVLSAPNAEEAVLLAQKHGYDLRAMVTDIVMPGMSGLELAQVVSRILPRLPILFVSGHGNDAISPKVLGSERTDFLQKPYRGEELAAKVGDILNRFRPGMEASALTPAV